MTTNATVYLVSGASRGLGLGLVTHILTKHRDAFVYAGARDPTGPGAKTLRALQEEYSERLSLIQLVAADLNGNKAAAAQIEARHGRVDTVIANTGIGNFTAPVADVPPAELDEHFHVNVTGTVIIFQAVHQLLRNSTSPRFVAISSSTGQLTWNMFPLPIHCISYGTSKAALNWAIRKLHFENDWLVTFPICPGAVDTEMRALTFCDITPVHNNVARDTSGISEKMKEAMPHIPTPEDAATGVLNVVDSSSREKHGGLFYNQNGEILNW